LNLLPASPKHKVDAVYSNAVPASSRRPNSNPLPVNIPTSNAASSPPPHHLMTVRSSSYPGASHPLSVPRSAPIDIPLDSRRRSVGIIQYEQEIIQQYQKRQHPHAAYSEGEAWNGVDETQMKSSADLELDDEDIDSNDVPHLLFSPPHEHLPRSYSIDFEL